MDKQFWTIERKPGESARDFILRTWREAKSDLPQNIANLDLTKCHAQTEVVKDGYESPYRFGVILRELVGEDFAPIFQATHTDGNGLTHAVYYAWGQMEQEADGDNGPTVAAFYNPQAGPTFGQPDRSGNKPKYLLSFDSDAQKTVAEIKAKQHGFASLRDFILAAIDAYQGA
jgi:hypothetical protein